MGTLLVALAAVLFIASLVVSVVALRRPKTSARPGGRQDPLAFRAPNAQTQFGPRQLGPDVTVSAAPPPGSP